jgi:hypothetical protein
MHESCRDVLLLLFLSHAAGGREALRRTTQPERNRQPAGGFFVWAAAESTQPELENERDPN